MSESWTARTTEQKVAVYRTCFSGRPDVYGTYDPATGRAWQVKQPVTDTVILAHLQGKRPYGIYLLVNDRIRALAVDFDLDDLGLPMSFRNGALSYGLASYIERSKSKGYHVWMFLDEAGIPAAKARIVVRRILEEIGQPSTEVFPKQDRLIARTTYGNYIYAPLFGALVPRGRTVFLDPGNGFKPHHDQWRVLETVDRITERQLEEIIELNELTDALPSGDDQNATRPPTAGHRSYGLPPCAQRMLAGGVTEFQRVSCFRLAVHLKKAGLSQDLAVAVLCAWAAKNHPEHGKSVITDNEIVRQTASAYVKRYRSCGCDDPAIRPFCDSTCPVRSYSASARTLAAGARHLSKRSTVMSNVAPSRPIKTFHAGTLRASIWRNEIEQNGRTVVRHTIRIDKRYFDSEREEWLDSDCLFVNDLPRIRLVAEKAFEFVALREREPDGEFDSAVVENDQAVIP